MSTTTRNAKHACRLWGQRDRSHLLAERLMALVSAILAPQAFERRLISCPWPSRSPGCLPS